MNWEQTKTYVEGKGGSLMTQAEIQGNEGLRKYGTDSWVAAYDSSGNKQWVQIGDSQHNFGVLHTGYPGWGDSSTYYVWRRYVVYKGVTTAKTYRVDAKSIYYGKELTGNPLPKDATTKVTLKRGHAGRHLKDRNGHCSDSSLYTSGGWELMEPTERYEGQKCDGCTGTIRQWRQRRTC